MEDLVKTIGIIVVVACLITYNAGIRKGKKEAYASAWIEAEKSLIAEISDLQNQIKITAENYSSKISSLQKNQASEIGVLEKKNASIISALKDEQVLEISKLKETQTNVLSTMQSEFAQELIDTRDSYYIKGQIEARDRVQNQIDEKAQSNIAKNDWNAPVFTIKK